MTDRNETLNRLIEAAKCLGATQARQIYGQYTIADGQVEVGLHKKIDQYRATLAQPEQEPVAWLVSDAQGRYATIRDPAPYGEEVYEPLYAAPPSKQWVGLTDEDTANICMQGDLNDWHDEQVIDAVEAKLKEKNT